MNGPSCKKVVSAEDVSNNSPTVRVLAKSVEMSGWNVKELLCEVAKLLSPQYSLHEGQTEKDETIDKIIEKATDIMERACKTNPELVMMALIQVPVSVYLFFVIASCCLPYPLLINFFRHHGHCSIMTW
jgi:CCR4-NOT transcription complex subunit 1